MNIVKELIDNHGYTVGKLSDLLKCSPRSVERWRDGEVEPWPVFNRQLEKVMRRATAKRAAEIEKERARA